VTGVIVIFLPAGIEFAGTVSVYTVPSLAVVVSVPPAAPIVFETLWELSSVTGLGSGVGVVESSLHESSATPKIMARHVERRPSGFMDDPFVRVQDGWLT